jgi:hypothetical protein
VAVHRRDSLHSQLSLSHRVVLAFHEQHDRPLGRRDEDERERQAGERTAGPDGNVHVLRGREGRLPAGAGDEIAEAEAVVMHRPAREADDPGAVPGLTERGL